MAPIYVKGGMWTNIEDEILKAAISKYGLNQWSRVSSLLTKKNAKQCKLRWQEWLDPRIKKSDWSADEDRKLLNLAKLRPNQWSSISLLLNRTANQCIERYQELLSDHRVIESNDPSQKHLLLTGNAESSNIGTRTAGSSLGGLNLNPESKPARPDLDEMDEDEKEMISEAKARLANTLGKKVKRKTRERILEESKRVADLLRRRELKQVGINAHLKTKKKFKDQMDYNADIAFERRPEEGVFDTTKELHINIRDKNQFDRSTQVGGTLNQEVEAQKRKEKRRREQNKRIVEGSNRDLLYDDTNEEDDEKYAFEFSKRRKLTFRKSNGGEQEDFDELVSEIARENNEKKSQKSILFSRKAQEEDAIGNNEDKKVSDKSKEKKERRKKKEERRRLNELLNSLPDPQDDFEIEVDGLLDETQQYSTLESKLKVESNTNSKGLHVIVDKTEQRRQEKRRMNELKEILKDFEMPQAMKSALPIPKVFPSKIDNFDEIDREMFKMMRDGKPDINTYLDLDELERSVSLWSKINKKIDDELSIDGKYEKMLILNNEITMHKKTLLNMIKKYTNSSVEIESRLESYYLKKRSELGIDTLIEEINKTKDAILKADDEIWAYSTFQEMESKSIEIRKERIQKELDYINTLIDNKRQELIN